MIKKKIKAELLEWIKENLNVDLKIEKWEEKAGYIEEAIADLPVGESWFDSLLSKAQVTIRMGGDVTGISCYMNIQYEYNRMAGLGSNGNTIRVVYFYEEGVWKSGY